MQTIVILLEERYRITDMIMWMRRRDSRDLLWEYG